MDQAAFNARLIDLFKSTNSQGKNCAERAIEIYFSTSGEGFTGSRFEFLRNHNVHDSFTAEDIISTSALSVDIPTRPVIWLLSDDGQEKCAQLLRQVDPNMTIWSDEAQDAICEGGPMWKLWDLLRTANWPEPSEGNGLGGMTKRSKLLAAKRPHLIPITDVVVRDFFPEVGNYWEAFRNALLSESLREEIQERTKFAPKEVSLLRRIDVVVWTTQTRNLQDATW